MRTPCPKNVRSQAGLWVTALGMNEGCLCLHCRRLVQEISQDPAGILVTSYEQLRLQRRLLLGVEWGCAILDEGHKIRNPDAEVTLVAKQLPTVTPPACFGQFDCTSTEKIYRTAWESPPTLAQYCRAQNKIYNEEERASGTLSATCCEVGIAVCRCIASS